MTGRQTDRHVNWVTRHTLLIPRPNRRSWSRAQVRTHPEAGLKLLLINVPLYGRKQLNMNVPGCEGPMATKVTLPRLQSGTPELTLRMPILHRLHHFDCPITVEHVFNL